MHVLLVLFDDTMLLAHMLCNLICLNARTELSIIDRRKKEAVADPLL